MFEFLSVTSGWYVFLIFFGLAFLLQLDLVFRLKPLKLVGDENEYVGHNNATGKGKLWVRVPFYGWLLALTPKFNEEYHFNSYRVFNGLIAALVVGLSVWYITDALNWYWGLFSGVVSLLVIERSILAIHLWPETLLGLLLLSFCISVESWSSQTAFMFTGLIIAFAFATRIDYLGLLPVSCLLLFIYGEVSTFTLMNLLVPFLVTFVFLSIYNGVKFGIWLPDTTLLFNIKVFNNELKGSDKPVQTLMQETVKEFKSHNGPAVEANWSLWKIAYHFFRRLKNIIGKEVFITENLLQKNQGNYSGVGFNRFSKIIKFNLSYMFTLVFFTYLALIAFIPLVFTISLGAIIFAASAIQTRGRYRVATIPTMITGIIFGLHNMLLIPMLWSGILIGVVCMICAAAILLVPQRHEIA